MNNVNLITEATERTIKSIAEMIQKYPETCEPGEDHIHDYHMLIDGLHKWIDFYKELPPIKHINIGEVTIQPCAEDIQNELKNITLEDCTGSKGLIGPAGPRE